MVNTSLSPLNPEDCKKLRTAAVPKVLQSAYSIAAENHDLEYFKGLLRLWQEEEEEEETPEIKFDVPVTSVSATINELVSKRIAEEFRDTNIHMAELGVRADKAERDLEEQTRSLKEENQTLQEQIKSLALKVELQQTPEVYEKVEEHICEVAAQTKTKVDIQEEIKNRTEEIKKRTEEINTGTKIVQLFNARIEELEAAVKVFMDAFGPNKDPDADFPTIVIKNCIDARQELRGIAKRVEHEEKMIEKNRRFILDPSLNNESVQAEQRTGECMAALGSKLFEGLKKVNEKVDDLRKDFARVEPHVHNDLKKQVAELDAAIKHDRRMAEVRMQVTSARNTRVAEDVATLRENYERGVPQELKDRVTDVETSVKTLGNRLAATAEEQQDALEEAESATEQIRERLLEFEDNLWERGTEINDLEDKGKALCKRVKKVEKKVRDHESYF